MAERFQVRRCPKAPPNNSLNRSGNCISFMIFYPFKVVWIGAAWLIRALGIRIGGKFLRLLSGGSRVQDHVAFPVIKKYGAKNARRQ